MFFFLSLFTLNRERERRASSINRSDDYVRSSLLRNLLKDEIRSFEVCVYMSEGQSFSSPLYGDLFVDICSYYIVK